MNRVLVLDGNARAAITIIRSLGRSGVKVDVGAEYRAYSTYSRYCCEFIKYPSPLKEKEKFLSFILQIIKMKKYNAIIPVDDETTDIMSELNNNSTEEIPVCLPFLDNYLTARSKIETINLAKRLNIPHPVSIPTTEFNNDTENLVQKTLELLILPVILKPEYESGSRGIYFIKNVDELKKTIPIFIDKYKKGLIQEYIPYGGSYGVEMLYNKGELKAKFTHKRIREYPVHGGPSTCRESVRFLEIESYSKVLLDSLNWNGVAMVEFRIDARNGVPRLMEINPRFWGSLAMAYHAGVDFPKLFLELIVNKKCDEIFNDKLGIQTRWLLWGDVLWLLSRKRKKMSKEELYNFFSFRIHDDIIDRDDLKPVLGTIIDSFRMVFFGNKLKDLFNRGW